MANKVKGITIELNADAKGVKKAFMDLKADSQTVERQLKEIDRALKFDPGNTALLEQRQKLLAEACEKTKDQLEAARQAQQAFVDSGGDLNSEAYTQLVIETERLSEHLRYLEERANDSVSALEKIGAAADKVASGADKVASATKGMSMAAAGALTGIAGMAYKAVTASDDLNTLAKQSGFTTAELQKMEYAADRIDVSMEDITSSAQKLKRNMGSDTGAVAEAFSTLGIRVRDSNGAMRDSTEVYWEVIAALSQVSNETERDQLAMTLLGKGADSLAGIIDDGGAALRAYGDEAENLGLILSQDTLDSLNQTNDALDKLKATAKATMAQTGAKALEAFLPVLERILVIINSVLEWVGSLNSKQISMLVTILAIVAAISPIASIIGGIASAVSALIPIVSLLFGAVMANPVALVIAAIGAAVVGLTVLIIANWDKIKAAWSAMVDKIKSGAAAIGEAIKAGFEMAGNAAMSVLNGLISMAKAVANGIVSLIEGAINGVLSMLNALISAINSVINAVAGLFGASYSGLSRYGTVRLPRFANGGSISSGAALVGEVGPELLTVSAGRATVYPLTDTAGGKRTAGLSTAESYKTDVTINFTGSLSQLAAVLQPVIKAETTRRGVSLIK